MAVPNRSFERSLSKSSHMGRKLSTESTFDDTYVLQKLGVPFTTSCLVCWAWQVAQGMDYLASRKV